MCSKLLKTPTTVLILTTGYLMMMMMMMMMRGWACRRALCWARASQFGFTRKETPSIGQARWESGIHILPSIVGYPQPWMYRPVRTAPCLLTWSWAIACHLRDTRRSSPSRHLLPPRCFVSTPHTYFQAKLRPSAVSAAEVAII